MDKEIWLKKEDILYYDEDTKEYRECTDFPPYDYKGRDPVIIVHLKEVRDDISYWDTITFGTNFERTFEVERKLYYDNMMHLVLLDKSVKTKRQLDYFADELYEKRINETEPEGLIDNETLSEEEALALLKKFSKSNFVSDIYKLGYIQALNDFDEDFRRFREE